MNRLAAFAWVLLGCLVPLGGGAASNVEPHQEMEQLNRQYQADRQMLKKIVETNRPLPDYFMLLRDIDALEAALRQFEDYLARLSKEQKRSVAGELQVRTSRVLIGDQPGSYTIRVPEGFEAPYTVRVAGGGLIVQKSPDPLQGSFRGSASTQDSSHTMSFLLKDAHGRTAQGQATVTVRGLDARTLDSQRQPTQVLYSAPPRPHTLAPSPAPVAEDTEDYAAKYRQIRETYEQESQRIREQQQRTQEAIRERYQYNKPAPAPAWGTPPSQTAPPKASARTYPVDASDCRNSFYSCDRACKGNSSCISSCSSANDACKRSKCPGGSVSGRGWNLVCTMR